MLGVITRSFFYMDTQRHRTRFSRLVGLNFLQFNTSKLFDKKFGLPGKFYWKCPRVRRFERAAHSRKHRIWPDIDMNDCLLLGKVKFILQKFYMFEDDIRNITKRYILKKSKAETIQYIKMVVGLPSKGQRTKTNARTCKLSRVHIQSEEAQRFLSLIAKHQSMSFLIYAKKLATQHEKIVKFRKLRDLMQQRRYRPKASVQDIDKHYDDIYQKIIDTKKRKKNISRK